MSSTHQRSFAVARPIAALGAGLALFLTGCGTGQVAQTAEQVAAVNGGDGTVGQIVVRNATFPFPDGEEHYHPAGEDVPLMVTIANTGSDDELVSITTPAADEVEIEGSSDLRGQSALRSSSLGSGESSIANPGEIRITLRDLKQDVRPGLTVPVTFLFRVAGELTLQVPIGRPEGPRDESDH